MIRKEEEKFECTEQELKDQLAKYGDEIKEDNPNYEAFKIYAEDDVKFAKARDFLVENNTFKAAEKKTTAKKDTKKAEEENN